MQISLIFFAILGATVALPNPDSADMSNTADAADIALINSVQAAQACGAAGSCDSFSSSSDRNKLCNDRCKRCSSSSGVPYRSGGCCGVLSLSCCCYFD